MAGEAVSFGATQEFKERPEEKKIFGVTVCTVLNSIDCTGGARVQLMLPWLPGFQPWARISNQMAGMAHGSHFVPLPGTEVLVSFNHGDVREPYVVGSLWNTIDRPPTLAPTDALSKRKIRTPLGHELAFDELLQEVTLTSNTKSTVTLDPEKAELSTPFAKVTVGKLGDVTISAATTLKLKARFIEIDADATVSITGKLNATLESKALCEVKGKPVKIN